MPPRAADLPIRNHPDRVVAKSRRSRTANLSLVMVQTVRIMTDRLRHLFAEGHGSGFRSTLPTRRGTVMRSRGNSIARFEEVRPGVATGGEESARIPLVRWASPLLERSRLTPPSPAKNHKAIGKRQLTPETSNRLPLSWSRCGLVDASVRFLQRVSGTAGD